MKRASLRKRFLRALVIYTLDMLFAIGGWVYGFGLHVTNWAALIVICLVWRFIFHMLSVVFAYDDAEQLRGKNEHS